MSILKFVVLSDLHLGLPEQPVNGLDTAARLTEAVQVIARDHSDAAFVLLAGDLADRGEAGAYSLLQSIIVSLPMPVHITLGNHDDRSTFLSVFGPDRDDPKGRVSQVIDAGNHRIILLDTSEPGLVGGRLCRGRLDWLAARLDEALDRPVIIVQHHHANPLSLPVDEIILENAEDYVEVLRRHPEVRQVIAGHVHLPSTAVWRGIPMTTMAGSHYSVTPHVPGVPGRQRQLEGPAQMAVVLATDDGVTVHFQDHLERHLTMAPGLFH
ncbi:metallophosphoesterase [Tabrizicola sp.]|uniref:metallophosphoesterase n=1 Tax=Tabrizicola sp. TaxID=2005166 RepID=UPI0025E0AEDF|nr:metallophosphoesterase [Tabrizicola sp.]